MMAQERSIAVRADAATVAVPKDFSEDIDLIQRTFAKDLTVDELRLFVAIAHGMGLSITHRQIHAVKRKSRNGPDTVTFQVGIDGYRSIAEAHPDYAGQDGPYWCGDDGQWTDVWLDKQPPRAAKVGIFRTSFKQPVFAVALWDEYFQTNSQGDLTPLWKKMPALMLAKCCEGLAIRKAFPAKLSGTYSDGEMGQANNPDDVAHAIDVAVVADGAVTADRDSGVAVAARSENPRHDTSDARSRDRDQANRYLHAWASEAGLSHGDLHYAAQALFRSRNVQSLTELGTSDLDGLHGKLRDAHNVDPAKLRAWLDSITPPSEPEVIETEGRLPGVDEDTGEVIDTEALAAYHRQ